jgi:hypothetical protein
MTDQLARMEVLTKWFFVANQRYIHQCSLAALFWYHCLEGKYDLTDRSSLSEQTKVVRPKFNELVAAFVAGNAFSGVSSVGFYRQDRDCEENRRRKRRELAERIRGGGEGEEEEEEEDCNLVERTFQVEFEVQSGATTQRFGASGFEIPCNIKNGRGVYDIAAFCESVEKGQRHKTKDVMRYLLYKFGRVIWDMCNIHDLFGDSEYTISHLALMVEGQEVLEHVDSADISAQLITTFGEYSGGMLEILVDGQWKSVDTRYRPTLVEGRFWHRVKKVTSGRRLALITYKNTDGKRSDGTEYSHLSPGFLR